MDFQLKNSTYNWRISKLLPSIWAFHLELTGFHSPLLGTFFGKLIAAVVNIGGSTGAGVLWRLHEDKELKFVIQKKCGDAPWKWCGVCAGWGQQCGFGSRVALLLFDTRKDKWGRSTEETISSKMCHTSLNFTRVCRLAYKLENYIVRP